MFLLSSIKKAYLDEVYRKRNIYQLEHGAWKPNVMSLNDTLSYIFEKRASITRFGDGEFKWMLGIKQNSFQEDSSELRKLLLKTFSIRKDSLLICVPDAFGDLSKYNSFASNYWSTEMCLHREAIKKLFISDDYTYGNPYITRFYMDYIDKSHVKGIIDDWRKIFSKRKIYIIEGEFSRLGVGNDLFSTAASIQRILAPAKNAFSSYEKILDFIQKNTSKDSNVLLLLALGPTATIMVPFLADMGYQALDIGHIDVEYEWYKLHAKKKTPILGRYVNEAGGFKNEFPPEILKTYNEEILARIDC